MKKIVIDTNIAVSALLFRNSVPDRALRWASIHCIILLSEATWTELEKVLSRRKFNKYFSVEQRITALQNFKESAQIIKIISKIELCRDPKDNKFLELAADGQADYLITGDQDLLALNSFRKTEIITPAQFLDKNLN
jgi:putative PIN family toxin of toxin-antitoxin system